MMMMGRSNDRTLGSKLLTPFQVRKQFLSCSCLQQLVEKAHHHLLLFLLEKPVPLDAQTPPTIG